MYVDPVALKNWSDAALRRSSCAQRTTASVSKIGIYHVVIRLDGAVPDLEAWAKSFDYGAMLGAIDAQ